MYEPPQGTKPLDLRNAHLKIKRAKTHIADLEAQRIRFLGDNRYFGVPKFDAETNRTQFILETIPTIPDDIPLLLGDCVHNLRSALDYLACELVRSSGVDPKRVYFPIYESAERYKAKSDGKTKGMPVKAKQLIDGLCPYSGGNDPLWTIHELDRIDKHRLLPTVTMKVGSWSMTMDQNAKWYGFAFIPELKAGDIIGDVEGDHEADKQMSITTDIAFGEPEIAFGKPLFPVVTELTEYVEKIVAFFG